MIAGVCGGIAQSLGIDPIWVRLAFLFGGLGTIYIVLAVLMEEPDENS